MTNHIRLPALADYISVLLGFFPVLSLPSTLRKHFLQCFHSVLICKLVTVKNSNTENRQVITYNTSDQSLCKRFCSCEKASVISS